MITDKGDIESVNSLIQLGYPDNVEYLDELLSWTCDPNWPIAAEIYDYFVKLGMNEVGRVLKLADQVDGDWRYSLITNLIAYYDDRTLEECVSYLISWSKQVGNDESDIESIRVLYDKSLLDSGDVKKIAKRNEKIYKLWIEETLSACGVIEE